MFSGIVEEVGKVIRLSNNDLAVQADIVLGELELGSSVAVNGVCLTITSLHEGGFETHLSPETNSRTTLGSLRSGEEVNLELPLTYGGRIGGHLVEGHVDGTADVTAIVPDQDSFLYTFGLSNNLIRYIVEKGFVAVEGISLTVVSCCPTLFSVSVIPYTRSHTVLRNRVPGDLVNIEIDILAKYVERLIV